MIGERIKRARLAAGLSLREVARLAELSAMAISKYERGETTPTSGSLVRLARALNTRAEFFFRPGTVSLGRPMYRNRSTLGSRQLARIEADILDRVERFLELVDCFPTPPVASFAVPPGVPPLLGAMEQLEDVAGVVREAWQLGINGIPRLADTLEEHGLLVLTTSAEATARFDGLAATVDGHPLVVVGAEWPGDRQRFTMAHELGHLILAGRLAPELDEEKACNRFAGAFLAPKDAVLHELGPHRSQLEFRELYALKHEYGLSMLSWILRAREVGVISTSTADGLCREFTTRSWRTREPGDPVPPEVPGLFERLVLRALAEDMISQAKGAELMGLSLNDFLQRRSFEVPRGAADQ